MIDQNDSADEGALVDCDLLEEIVCALVEHPEAVRVEETVEGRKSTFRIHTHPDDAKHVIGRKGATVAVLRQLFTILAGKHGRDYPAVSSAALLGRRFYFDRRTATKRGVGIVRQEIL